LSIKHVVHLPKTALQSGGFRSERSFSSVLVVREGKIAKDNAQTPAILFHQFVDENGDIAAGRALEIAKLFKRNRRLRVAANVHRIREDLTDQALIPGKGQKLRPLCPTEQRSAPECSPHNPTSRNKMQVGSDNPTRA